LQDLYNVYQSLQIARRSDFFTERRHALLLTMIAMVSYAVMVSLLFIESITNRAADYLQLFGEILAQIHRNPIFRCGRILLFCQYRIIRKRSLFLINACANYRHRRIYLIKNQNRMLRVEIAICLNGYTCVHNTTVEADPPGTTTESEWAQQAEILAEHGQVISVNSYLDVEPWLVQKIKNQLRAE
uniref:Transposase n=1 Tax=Gongylonema pulchrum TaxID=637853 RepID=A0A183ECM1_9BILA